MGVRKILVNGTEFHWKVDILAHQQVRVIHLRVWQIRAGRTLIADLVGQDQSPEFTVDSAYPTPKDVRLIIEYGLSKGWKADGRGANLSLTSADEIELAALRLIDPPQRDTA